MALNLNDSETAESASKRSFKEKKAKKKGCDKFWYHWYFVPVLSDNEGVTSDWGEQEKTRLIQKLKQREKKKENIIVMSQFSMTSKSKMFKRGNCCSII